MEGKRIIIPIHSNKSMIQLAYASKLQQIFSILGHQVSIINLDASDDLWYVQNYIANEKADLLVTIDCSGFELRLLGDDLFYNSLCIPVMHFITRNPRELKEELSQRMNFTMEFYVMDDEYKKYIEENCWRVPCVHKLSECFDIDEINRLASGEVKINEYIPSEEILNKVKELPEVFVSIFMNAVDKRKGCKNINNYEVLDEYLKELNFDATQREKEELVAFVDLGFIYQESLELEEKILYIHSQLQKIL